MQRRYLENVPTIVPVLEKEYRNASKRLEETQVELHDLHPEKLKVGRAGPAAPLLRSARVQPMARPAFCALVATPGAPAALACCPDPAGEGPHLPRGLPLQAGAAAARYRGSAARALWRDARRRAHPRGRLCGARQQAGGGARAPAQRSHAAVWWRAVPPRHGRVPRRWGRSSAGHAQGWGC